MGKNILDYEMPWFEWEHFMLIFVRIEIVYLRSCGSPKKIMGPQIAKNIYRSPQIRKLSHLQNARKSKKIKSANLWICDLQN